LTILDLCEIAGVDPSVALVATEIILAIVERRSADASPITDPRGLGSSQLIMIAMWSAKLAGHHGGALSVSVRTLK